MIESVIPVYQEKDYADLLTTYFGYRWYIPWRKLDRATVNAINFHDWILALKEDDAYAKTLFYLVLYRCVIDSVVDSPKIIITVPPSRSFEECPDYPLAQIGEEIARKRRLPTATVKSLKRIKTIARAVDDRSVRDVLVQRESLKLDQLFPRNTYHFLIIDDVTTSGASFKAASQMVRERHPQAKISCFAFGKTPRQVPDQFPEMPHFPARVGFVQYDLDRFAGSLFEGKHSNAR
jgi:hypothetical protein